MKLILTFFIIFLTTQVVYAEEKDLLIEKMESQAKLAEMQHDLVREELSSLLFYQYRDLNKSEIVSILKGFPKAKENPHYVSVEGDYVSFGATVSFEFKENKLVRVIII